MFVALIFGTACTESRATRPAVRAGPTGSLQAPKLCPKLGKSDAATRAAAARVRDQWD